MLLALILPLDLGAPFGGLAVIGGVVALGLWLFALHLVVIIGWLTTQSFDALLARATQGDADRAGRSAPGQARDRRPPRRERDAR